MGKVVIEVPGAINVTFKAADIAEAVKKLTQLKRTGKKEKTRDIKEFKGVSRFPGTRISEEEWYHQ